MVVKLGRLIRKHGFEAPVRYIEHDVWFNGVPSYCELVDVSVELDQNELLLLRADDGRAYPCVVLDSNSACAVIATL